MDDLKDSRKTAIIISGTSESKPSEIRSLTRLIIGGLVLGMDEVSQRMSEWDKVSTQTTAYSQDQLDEENTYNNSHVYEQQDLVQQAETPGQLARYALIGFVFETEERISSGFSRLNRFGNALGRAANPLFKTLSNSRRLSPVRKRYNKLVNRGEAEVSRWITLGRAEETSSRQLAHIALDETVDSSIEILAVNPEIQDLIQSQGTGLAYEVVEEIRERTVSADTFLEGIMRSMLLRKPRSEVPAPPIEVRMRALSVRPKKKDQDKATDDDKSPVG